MSSTQLEIRSRTRDKEVNSMSSWLHGHCKCCNTSPCPTPQLCPSCGTKTHTPDTIEVSIALGGNCCINDGNGDGFVFGDWIRMEQDPLVICCYQSDADPCVYEGVWNDGHWATYSAAGCAGGNQLSDMTSLCAIRAKVWQHEGQWRVEVWDARGGLGRVPNNGDPWSAQTYVLYRTILPLGVDPCSFPWQEPNLLASNTCGDDVTDATWNGEIVAMTGGLGTIGPCCDPTCCDGASPPTVLSVVPTGIVLAPSSYCHPCDSPIEEDRDSRKFTSLTLATLAADLDPDSACEYFSQLGGLVTFEWHNDTADCDAETPDPALDSMQLQAIVRFHATGMSVWIVGSMTLAECFESLEFGAPGGPRKFLLFRGNVPFASLTDCDDIDVLVSSNLTEDDIGDLKEDHNNVRHVVIAHSGVARVHVTGTCT